MGDGIMVGIAVYFQERAYEWMKEKAKEQKVLSEAEQKRLERFEQITEEMQKQGYTRHDLRIRMNDAFRFSIGLLVVLLAVGYGLYCFVHRSLNLTSLNGLLVVIIMLALIVIHELIHGVCWSIFTPHHFKDVAFGILKSSMTPYCTCQVLMKKPTYIFGAVMPLLVLGVIPMLVGVAIGNLNLLTIGILMADAAAGDILIIHRVMGYKSDAKEQLYMDYPTEAGCVVFER